MGTNTSVERFDGIRLEHYMVEGSNENLKRVFALIEMPDNELWVGTGMGLFRLADDAEKLERLAPEMITSGVHAFCKLGDVLYVGTEKGLYVYKGGVFEHVLVDKNVFSRANFVTGMVEGENGILWLSTMGGLKSFRLSDQTITSFSDKLAKNGQNLSFYNITRIGSKIFMGTMTSGLVLFDTASKHFSRYLDVLAHIYIDIIWLGEKLRCLVYQVGGQDAVDQTVLIVLVKLLQSVGKQTEGRAYEYLSRLAAL
jgi:ligand-binding sensor domain-containing protein